MTQVFLQYSVFEASNKREEVEKKMEEAVRQKKRKKRKRKKRMNRI